MGQAVTRRFPGHTTVPLVCMAILLGVAAKAEIARGDDCNETGSAHPEGFGYARGWKVQVGEACRDTLEVPWGEVLPVAASVLIDDEWRVQSTDRIRGRIVTEWQPVSHSMVQLFFGEVRERCVVDITPLDVGSCVVLFRAGLATRESISGNPLLPSVRKAYLKGVRDWQRKVREALESRPSPG